MSECAKANRMQLYFGRLMECKHVSNDSNKDCVKGGRGQNYFFVKSLNRPKVESKCYTINKCSNSVLIVEASAGMTSNGLWG